MAKPSVYNWPIQDLTAICAAQGIVQNLTAICATQNIGIAGSLVLNGTLAITQAGTPIVIFPGYSRTVSITSANTNPNLSGINFTIVGTYNGAPQSRTIAGPTAGNTVETTGYLFDTVTSVSADGAFGNGAEVGTGTTGATHWFLSNYHATVLGLQVQVAITATTINYSFQTTLDDVSNNTSPTLFTPITAMTGATTNQLSSYLVPTRYSRILVNSGSNNTGKFTATFLQQGIT